MRESTNSMYYGEIPSSTGRADQTENGILGDDSSVKSVHCSSTAPKFSFLHSSLGHHSCTLTPTPGDGMPLASLGTTLNGIYPHKDTHYKKENKSLKKTKNAKYWQRYFFQITT